jgi:hypothetical protein
MCHRGLYDDINGGTLVDGFSIYLFLAGRVETRRGENRVGFVVFACGRQGGVAFTAFGAPLKFSIAAKKRVRHRKKVVIFHTYLVFSVRAQNASPGSFASRFRK